MTSGMLLSSASILTLLTFRSIIVMNARTAPGIRAGILMMCIGGAAIIVKTLIPAIHCVDSVYNWLIPAGAAIYMLSDRRRRNGSGFFG